MGAVAEVTSFLSRISSSFSLSIRSKTTFFLQQLTSSSSSNVSIWLTKMPDNLPDFKTQSVTHRQLLTKPCTRFPTQQLLSTEISIYFTTALHQGRNSFHIWTMCSFMTPNPFHIAPLQAIYPSLSLISLWYAYSLLSHVSSLPSTVAITTEAERERERGKYWGGSEGGEEWVRDKDKSHLWVWGEVFNPRWGDGCHLFILHFTLRRSRIVAFQFHRPILKCDLLFELS